MTQNHGSALHSLYFFELIYQPLQLTSRVIESSERTPVLKVTNVCIKRQDASLIIKLLCKVLIVLEKFFVHLVVDELEPGGRPRLEILVIFGHGEHILRISVMIANSWDYLTLMVRKAINYELGSILH